METKNQSLMDAVLASNMPHEVQLDMLRLIRGYESVVMQGRLLSACTNLMLAKHGPQEFAEEAWDEETKRITTDSSTIPSIKHIPEQHLIILEGK